jgi:hypothetical protein
VRNKLFERLFWILARAIDLEAKLFNESREGFTSRVVAYNVGDACSLVESGFECVTGEYDDEEKSLENETSKDAR